MRQAAHQGCWRGTCNLVCTIAPLASCAAACPPAGHEASIASCSYHHCAMLPFAATPSRRRTRSSAWPRPTAKRSSADLGAVARATSSAQTTPLGHGAPPGANRHAAAASTWRMRRRRSCWTVPCWCLATGLHSPPPLLGDRSVTRSTTMCGLLFRPPASSQSLAVPVQWMLAPIRLRWGTLQ